MNGRTYSVRMEGAKYGVSFGSALAIAISYATNHSILWAIIHGDLQLVIRRLFRAIQDIETAIRERLSYRCSRQPIGDARRTSHAEPFSLDAGAPEITSSAVALGGDIPCCSEEDMAVAVDTNSCVSCDLISIRSNPKPVGRTDQLPETGAAAIEPGVGTSTEQVHQRRPPSRSGQGCN